MSIPTYTLRFAGTWNSTARYIYADIVVSPTDNQAYVWIGSQPITGGGDPSIALGDWINMPPSPSGDITGVTAGTGLSGGGSVGVVSISNAGVITAKAGTGIKVGGTQDITVDNDGVLTAKAGTGLLNTGTDVDPIFENAGVLDIDGVTGSFVTKLGQYYKTSQQTLGSGNTDVTFDRQQSWTLADGIINWRGGSRDFTVEKHGIYQLEFSATILANSSTWTTSTNKSISIDITRSPTAEQTILATQSLMANATSYSQLVSGTIELFIGDVINCKVVNIFTVSGVIPPAIQCLQNTFDYNTTFSWTLIKPL